MLLIFLAFLIYVTKYSSASNQTCAHPEEFCGQGRMVRHEVRYPDNQSPSFCSYGDPKDFVPNQHVKVDSCGWPGLDKSRCSEAGCCFKNGICYKPIRSAEAMTFYQHEWVSFDTAQAVCRIRGMDLPCVTHPADLLFLSRATCGTSWLAGQLRDDVNMNSKKIPYYNPFTCDHGEIQTVCERDDDVQHALSLNRIEGSNRITNVSLSERKHLFCAQEYWNPILEVYPQHQVHSSTRRVATFSCVGNAIARDYEEAVLQVNLTWVIRDFNNDEIKRHEMPGRHNSTIQEEHIGKYTCTISLLLKPGILPFGAQGGVKNERHVTGHAFHYMPVTVQVYISISSPTENTPRVDHELVSGKKPYFLLLGDAVLLEMDLNGYPFPHISVDSSTAGKFKKSYSRVGGTPFKRTDWWVLESFGEDIWIYADEHIQNVVVSFLSVTQPGLIPAVTFFLQKTDVVSQIHQPLPNKPPYRTIDVDINEPFTLQCYGYGTGTFYTAQTLWYIDNEYYLDRGVTYSVIDEEQGFIQLTPISAIYSGVYKCVLDNGAGEARVFYKVRVRDKPLRPDSPGTTLKSNQVVIRIPITSDPWDAAYNLTVTESSGLSLSIVFEADLSANKTRILNSSIDTFYNNSDAEYIRITDKSAESDFRLVINKWGTIVIYLPIDTSAHHYKLKYTVSNQFGTSLSSPSSPWTMRDYEVAWELLMKVAEWTVKASHDRFIFSPKPLGEVPEFYDVHYYDLNSETEEIIRRVDGSNKMVEITNVSKSTWYVFYVQALSSPLKTDVYYNDNVSTKNNGSMNNTIVQMPASIMRKGPYTSTFKIKTKDSTFNNVTYSPKKLIVQQIDNRDNSVVVSVQWKFVGDIKLVKNFKLSVSELERGVKHVKRDVKGIPDKIIPKSSSSILLKHLKLGLIYAFSLTTISQFPGEVSVPAVVTIKLSEERCAVPPPIPSLCGVLLYNENQLVVLVNDEANNPGNNIDCYIGDGAAYEGRIRHTTNGQLCKEWASAPGNYRKLRKNFCRNPETQPGIIGPWCYTADDVIMACDIPPCGNYLTNITLSSASNLTLQGTSLCVSKKSSDYSVKLETWYDYGPGSPSCAGQSSVVELDFEKANSVASLSHVTRNDLVNKIWYRYITLVTGNILVVFISMAIIHCKSKILKNMAKDKKEKRRNLIIDGKLS